MPISLAEICMAPFTWRNLNESGGICERKTLFWMKKEVDQAGFKSTRTKSCNDGGQEAIQRLLPSALCAVLFEYVGV